MSCSALGISILYRLNERCKYNAFALIVFCSFCCATCLGYEPVGKLFDLETTHSIDVKSSHSGRVIPLLVSLLEKKGLLPVVLFSHGLGGSRNGYKYLRTCWVGGDTRQFSFSIQVVMNHFFKACLLAKLSGNFEMLRHERIWSYGRSMVLML